MMSAETCFVCDEETGRAGRSEDSIYCDVCDEGPFCSSCWDEHPHNAGGGDAVAALVVALRKCRQHIADTRAWRPHADIREGELPFGTTDYYHMDDLIAEADKALAAFREVRS